MALTRCIETVICLSGSYSAYQLCIARADLEVRLCSTFLTVQAQYGPLEQLVLCMAKTLSGTCRHCHVLDKVVLLVQMQCRGRNSSTLTSKCKPIKSLSEQLALFPLQPSLPCFTRNNNRWQTARLPSGERSGYLAFATQCQHLRLFQPHGTKALCTGVRSDE
jgi:hypothetical protein